MENKTKNKRRSMTIVIVVLELLVLFLIGFVIRYHGQARDLEEQNAANNEAADRLLASAFLDIHEEMTGDRQEVFNMSMNFDREGFNSLCAGLGSHYIDESNIIAGRMEKDLSVTFAGHTFVCVDRGFGEHTPVDVVVRPEDIKIVPPEQGMIRGEVQSLVFFGTFYEMMVESNDGFTWLLQNTEAHQVGETIGMNFGPNDIHIMKKGE